MKSIIVILLFMVCSSAFADLTQRDLEKIQQMLDKQKAELREYIDLKVDPIRKDLDKQKEDLREYIDLKVDPIKDAISTLYWIVGLIGVFIVAVLAAPQWITIRREREDRKLAEKIDMIEKEIAELKNR